jgi:hypothetical protein
MQAAGRGIDRRAGAFSSQNFELNHACYGHPDRVDREGQAIIS